MLTSEQRGLSVNYLVPKKVGVYYSLVDTCRKALLTLPSRLHRGERSVQRRKYSQTRKGRRRDTNNSGAYRLIVLIIRTSFSSGMSSMMAEHFLVPMMSQGLSYQASDAIKYVLNCSSLSHWPTDGFSHGELTARAVYLIQGGQ